MASHRGITVRDNHYLTILRKVDNFLNRITEPEAEPSSTARTCHKYLCHSILTREINHLTCAVSFQNSRLDVQVVCKGQVLFQRFSVRARQSVEIVSGLNYDGETFCSKKITYALGPSHDHRRFWISRHMDEDFMLNPVLLLFQF